MIQDKEHLLHLVKYGVYFGYSTESIIQFIVDFDTAYDDVYDYRTNGSTAGTGHICSDYESLTQTFDMITKGINSRRYHHQPFPMLSGDVYDKQQMEIDTTRLYSSDFAFNHKVNIIIEHISKSYDVVLENEH